MRTFPVARLTVDAPQNSAMRRNAVARWLKMLAGEFETLPGEALTDGPYRARIWLGGGYAVGTLRVGAPGALSDETRARIAKWMRGRAKHLRNPNAVFDRRWFTQEFSL